MHLQVFTELQLHIYNQNHEQVAWATLPNLHDMEHPLFNFHDWRSARRRLFPAVVGKWPHTLRHRSVSFHRTRRPFTPRHLGHNLATPHAWKRFLPAIQLEFAIIIVNGKYLNYDSLRHKHIQMNIHRSWVLILLTGCRIAQGLAVQVRATGMHLWGANSMSWSLQWLINRNRWGGRDHHHRWGCWPKQMNCGSADDAIDNILTPRKSPWTISRPWRYLSPFAISKSYNSDLSIELILRKSQTRTKRFRVTT